MSLLIANSFLKLLFLPSAARDTVMPGYAAVATASRVSVMCAVTAFKSHFFLLSKPVGVFSMMMWRVSSSHIFSKPRHVRSSYSSRRSLDLRGT
jgi:hypothetical protein